MVFSTLRQAVLKLTTAHPTPADLVVFRSGAVAGGAGSPLSHIVKFKRGAHALMMPGSNAARAMASGASGMTTSNLVGPAGWPLQRLGVPSLGMHARSLSS
jgi:hypothetical protein